MPQRIRVIGALLAVMTAAGIVVVALLGAGW